MTDQQNKVVGIQSSE